MDGQQVTRAALQSNRHLGSSAVVALAIALAASAWWVPAVRAAESFASEDGAVTVQRPAESGWECLQVRQLQGDGVVTLVKCRPEEAGRFFFMTAKDATLSAREMKDAKSVVHYANKILKKTYKQLYSTVNFMAEGEVVHKGKPAFELVVDATHDRLGPVRKRERVVLVGDHLLTLTAEGSPEHYEQLQGTIEEWFAETEFSVLAPVAAAATP
jgi:hypothetical protein